jgi:hypothetical protein
LTASTLAKAGVYIVSTDEKTGIQALERMYPNRPMIAGHVELREFEYIRHGTLALIASFGVATGRIVAASVGPTRTEQDFADHIEAVIATDVKASWVFIVDQLNTHKSETLVRLVAKHCGLKQELGLKGKSGILASMPSRAAFLSCASHRIRFVYTWMAHLVVEPDRALVFDPGAQAAAPGQFSIHRGAKGPHRGLHRVFQRDDGAGV